MVPRNEALNLSSWLFQFTLLYLSRYVAVDGIVSYNLTVIQDPIRSIYIQFNNDIFFLVISCIFSSSQSSSTYTFQTATGGKASEFRMSSGRSELTVTAQSGIVGVEGWLSQEMTTFLSTFFQGVTFSVLPDPPATRHGQVETGDKTAPYIIVRGSGTFATLSNLIDSLGTQFGYRVMSEEHGQCGIKWTLAQKL